VTELSAKQDRLFESLHQMDRVIVAFSGGTDSAYLAWAANSVLGGNALAVTADSASLPESHKRDAESFVESFGIKHEYIQTREFDNPAYGQNNPDRCFHCKDELFTRLEEVGRQRGFKHIIYGVNVDDLSDYRPGQKEHRPAPVAVRQAAEDGAGDELAAGVGGEEERRLERRRAVVPGVDGEERDDERQPEDVHEDDEEDR
jgi:uncharacterized protein